MWIYWLTGLIILGAGSAVGAVLVRSYLGVRRIDRAIANARWEQSEHEVVGGRVCVEIVKVARWGTADDQSRVVSGPEHIMTVDPTDVGGPGLDDAYEAAALRMLTYNSVIRPMRRG